MMSVFQNYSLFPRRNYKSSKKTGLFSVFMLSVFQNPDKKIKTKRNFFTQNTSIFSIIFPDSVMVMKTLIAMIASLTILTGFTLVLSGTVTDFWATYYNSTNLPSMPGFLTSFVHRGLFKVSFCRYRFCRYPKKNT